MGIDNGYIDIVRFLIESGVDAINWRDQFGQTLLHIACGCCQFEMFQFFIERGIPLNIKNKGKMTALHIAVEQLYIEIIRFFT